MTHGADSIQVDSQRLRVLVVGGAGFIGANVAAALRQAGHTVYSGVRPTRALGRSERALDIVHSSEEELTAALHGIDVVVNASGILRPTRTQDFQQVHVEGPLRLVQACLRCGVQHFVQISALGDARDGEFIASKHAFDAALATLPLASTVLRPSVVYAPQGSYGGTSLLRALAGFPLFQWMPGDGRWLLSPIAMEDLAACVVAAVARRTPGIFNLGCEPPITLRDYQRTWRDWLRIPGTRVLEVPEQLVALQVRISERLGAGPVGETMWKMLMRGNVVPPGSAVQMQSALGVRVRPLNEVLTHHPAHMQDRWAAQLYFLSPTLRWVIVLLWLLSGWAGFQAPAAHIHALTEGTALAQMAPVALARAGAMLDLILGMWLCTAWRPRACLALMGVSVLAYTLMFGIFIPAQWLDPLGGLAKNLVVLPALAVAWILAERR